MNGTRLRWRPWFGSLAIAAAGLSMLGIGACAASADPSPAAPLGDVAAGGRASGGAGSGQNEGGQGIGQGGTGLAAAAELHGVVLAPDGRLPIHNAVIYLSESAPPPIEQKVFCDRCIDLSGKAFTQSAADGSFTLRVPAEGEYFLVVQKGSFRRVRTITVSEGSHDLEEALTTLPRLRDAAAGDDIPKMAVMDGRFDKIHNSLAKLGLGDVDGNGELIEDSEHFDYWDWQEEKLLLDYETLSQYHVLFMPCDDNWANAYLTDEAVLANLRRFVQDGGRLYVTDLAYNVIAKAFPGPVSFEGDTGEFDSAAGFAYDAPADVQDAGMKEWLAAQGISEFSVVDNYTAIASVQPYEAPDIAGTMATLEPKVWVKANTPDFGLKPSTISFEYGCGRVLFSTYDTENNFGINLAPQERALLYTLFELNVCLPPTPR